MTTWCVPLSYIAANNGSLDCRKAVVALMCHSTSDDSGDQLSLIVDPYPVDVVFEIPESDVVPVLDMWRPGDACDITQWITSWLDVDLPDVWRKNPRTGNKDVIQRHVRFASIHESLITRRGGLIRNRDNDAYWPRSTLLAQVLQREDIRHVAARSGASPEALQAICDGRLIPTSQMYSALVLATRRSVRDVISDLNASS